MGVVGVVRAALVVAVSLGVVACSDSGWEPPEAVTLEEASAPGYTDDVVAAVLVAQAPDKLQDTDDGAIVLVASDGSTRIVAAEGVGNEGDLAMNAHGHVAWAGVSGLRVLAGERSVTGPPSELGMGAAVVTDAQGRFHWLDGVTRWVTPTGVSGHRAYLLEQGAANGPDGGLLTTRLGSGVEPRRVATWDLRRHHRSSPAPESCGTSDPFGQDGRLWFLEQWCDGGATDQVLALASVDPVRGTYRAAPLHGYGMHGYRSTSDGGPSPLADAAERGHLHDGRLYTVDHRGVLVAADLRRGRLTDVGRLSERARRARDVRVAWAAGRMSVLVVDGHDDDAVLETYDLAHGTLERTLPVQELAGLVPGDGSRAVTGFAVR